MVIANSSPNKIIIAIFKIFVKLKHVGIIKNHSLLSNFIY
jgi:hypothetical protein